MRRWVEIMVKFVYFESEHKKTTTGKGKKGERNVSNVGNVSNVI